MTPEETEQGVPEVRLSLVKRIPNIPEFVPKTPCQYVSEQTGSASSQC